MGVDEQREEREVLASIYPDEITDLSDNEFRVSTILDISDEEDALTEPPTLILHVRYPPKYPDEAPELKISTPSNGISKYRFLDIQEDEARLLDSLQPVIEENLGMAMVFSLVSTLKDSAESLIAERREEVEVRRVAESAKAEEEENRKFHGTHVNRETFLQWRDAFRKEMTELDRRKQEEKELEDKRKRTWKSDKKFSGKELWDKGLVGKVDEEDEEGDDVLNVEKLKLNT